MSETETMAVYCGGITKSYGIGEARVQALRGIDLEVHPGELLMLENVRFYPGLRQDDAHIRYRGHPRPG